MKYQSVTYSGPLSLAIGAMKLMATSSKPGQRQRVDPDRRLAPFQPLRLAEQDARRPSTSTTPARRQKMKYDKPAVEHRPQRQPRNRPVQRSQKRVGEEAIGDRRWCGPSASGPATGARCR